MIISSTSSILLVRCIAALSRSAAHVLTGHGDFGGEVERIMGMVDGVVLLVDAMEVMSARRDDHTWSCHAVGGVMVILGAQSDAIF